MSSATTYTYKPPQPSLLFKHVLNPFYDRVVLLYPRCWTPNGITIFGIFCTLAASVLLLATLHRTANDNAGTPLNAEFGRFAAVEALLPAAAMFGAPAGAKLFFPLDIDSCVLVAAGILNLVYCIADNTDGKQARRWKMSSPIGEYLDHGLDCVTSLLSTVCLVGCGGLSTHAAAVAMLIIGFITNLSHVLNLRRNIFIWGSDYVSVDEAMIMFGVVPVLAGVWPEFRFATLDVAGYPAIRVVDVCIVLFLVSQVGMVHQITRNMHALWVDPIVIAQGGLVALLGWVAASHAGGTDARIAAQFRSVREQPIGQIPVLGELLWSYQACWFVTAACTLSMVVHVAIGSKCIQKTLGAAEPHVSMLPVFAAAACVALFAGKPWLGALASAGVHTVQALMNISAIKAASKKGKEDED